MTRPWPTPHACLPSVPLIRLPFFTQSWDSRATTSPRLPQPRLAIAGAFPLTPSLPSRPKVPREFRRASPAYHKTKPNAFSAHPFPRVSVKASREIKTRISKQYASPQIINKISKELRGGGWGLWGVGEQRVPQGPGGLGAPADHVPGAEGLPAEPQGKEPIEIKNGHAHYMCRVHRSVRTPAGNAAPISRSCSFGYK